MKKITSLILCIVAMVCMACGSKTASTAEYDKLKAEVMPVISNEANVKYWANTPDISDLFGAKITQGDVNVVAKKVSVRKAELARVQPKIEELRKLSGASKELKKDFEDDVVWSLDRCNASVEFNEINVKRNS